jgi:hypothetical protein
MSQPQLEMVKLLKRQHILNTESNISLGSSCSSPPFDTNTAPLFQFENNFEKQLTHNKGENVILDSSSSEGEDDMKSFPVKSPSCGLTHQELYAREKKEDEGGTTYPLLSVPSDNRYLSEYQCLVRKQIELFEVGSDELGSNAQGRNKPIVAGQVGVRCRHCSIIPSRHRTRGAHYYPAQLRGIYQAAQNLASSHLSGRCQLIPDELRQEILSLRDRKSSAGGGKEYWASSAASLGIAEVDGIIRFKPPEETNTAEV